MAAPAKSSDLARFGIAYALVAITSVFAAIVLSRHFGWPESAPKWLFMFFTMNSIIVYVILFSTDAVSSEKRSSVRRNISVLVAPLALTLNALIAASAAEYYPMTLLPRIAVVALYIVALLLGIGWVLLYSPFAKLNMATSGLTASEITDVFERLNWPLKAKEFEPTDIRLSTKAYLSFATGLFAAVFIILETVLGEVLSENIGSSTYIGASIIALIIAVFMYPAHKRASDYLEGASQRLSLMAESDEVNLTEAASMGVKAYIELIKRRWRLYLTALVIGLSLGGAVAILADTLFKT